MAPVPDRNGTRSGFRPASSLDDEAPLESEPDPREAGTSQETAPPSQAPVVLPYLPRPGQLDLAGRVYRALQDGTHAVLEAGTGTGKTVAVLAGALAATRQDGRRLIWLTRTNAQAQQVLVELQAIQDDPEARAAVGGPLLAVPMQGRHHLCPKLSEDPRYAGADSEEYARLCAALKRATPREQAHPAWSQPNADREHEEEASPGVVTTLPMASSAGCSYYAGLIESDPDRIAQEMIRSPMDAQEWAGSLEARGLCPYEAAKGIMKQARVVIAPYVYLADRRLARAMTDWLGCPLSECVLVVDEAHNLPDHLRDLYSTELGMKSLDRALSEAVKAGDPELAAGVKTSGFVRWVQAALEQVVQERLPPGEDDARVKREDLLLPLLSSLHLASPALLGVVGALEGVGQAVREEALRAGRLPRSYLSALARFLTAWIHASSAEYVPLVERAPTERLVLYCLDPAPGGRFLQEAHGSVHISGTLRPLKAHRDLLGLQGPTDCTVFPSPFARENLRLVLVDDVTTRFDERNRDGAMMDRLAAHVDAFARVKGVNAMVLFPSHALLGETKGLALDGFDRRVFVEAPAKTQKESHTEIEAYRAAGRRLGDPSAGGEEGALWVGVVGGRVSEGIDFPGSTLQALCLVGVPYPRPTARHEALLQFNEIRFAKGWEYTVEAPTLRRVLQAMGRVVRDAEDKGIVFLLDSRYRRWAHEFGRLERLGDEEEVEGVLVDWLQQEATRQNTGPDHEP